MMDPVGYAIMFYKRLPERETLLRRSAAFIRKTR